VPHIKAQYRNPAFTGDATFLRGTVTDVRVADGRGTVSVSVEMTSQTGQVMAKAVGTVDLPMD
jgi:hypothetical protein